MHFLPEFCLLQNTLWLNNQLIADNNWIPKSCYFYTYINYFYSKEFGLILLEFPVFFHASVIGNPNVLKISFISLHLLFRINKLVYKLEFSNSKYLLVGEIRILEKVSSISLLKLQVGQLVFFSLLWKVKIRFWRWISLIYQLLHNHWHLKQLTIKQMVGFWETY